MAERWALWTPVAMSVALVLWGESLASHAPPADTVALQPALQTRTNQGIAVLLSRPANGPHGIIRVATDGHTMRWTGRIAGLAPGWHVIELAASGDLPTMLERPAGFPVAQSDISVATERAWDDAQTVLGVEADAEGVAEFDRVDVQLPWTDLHLLIGRAVAVRPARTGEILHPPTLVHGPPQSAPQEPVVAAGVIGIGLACK